MDTSFPMITQLYDMDQASLRRFRRALRRADQKALDELLKSTQTAMAEAEKENITVTMELFIIALVLEEQREIIRIRTKAKQLNEKVFP